jgi:hypothetical protein
MLDYVFGHDQLVAYNVKRRRPVVTTEKEVA